MKINYMKAKGVFYSKCMIRKKSTHALKVTKKKIGLTL